MRIKIRYIDGDRIKRSIIASAGRISEMREVLNNINVFPVADADTGTNMAMTMQSIVASAQSCPYSSLSKVCDCISEGALNGARGNSGAILAQFFQGLSEGAGGRERLSPEEFADAVTLAVTRAREALANPREGTILTVMQDWADYLKQQAIGKEDFVELFTDGLKRARESLAETPSKLKILQKAGVVDAGAQGFVHLLEGLSDFIDSGKIAAYRAKTHMVEKIRHFHFHKIDDEITFRYCTEGLIQGEAIDKKELQKQLSQMGDSLIVVGSSRKARIHIHTNEPEAVFDLIGRFGAVLQTKAEDMQKQHDEALELAPKKGIALVTDSTCDLPPEFFEKYDINVVPVIIQIGDKGYQDRVEIQSIDFYKILEADTHRLTTSQPPVASFREVYARLVEKYEAIISIHISEGLSGTINGARIAAKEFAHKINIEVINSKTTSAGLGLVVHEAAKMIEEGLSLSELKDKIQLCVQRVKIFVSIPTLKYMIRSGRVQKPKGFLATLLQIKPVIGLNEEGKAMELAKVIGKKRVAEKTLELALNYARKLVSPKFIIVHMMAQEQAEKFHRLIKAEFAQEDIPVLDASPALGLHAGVGATAIAVLGDPLS